MLEIAAAGAGVVAAGSCCLAPTRRRARVAAIVMALVCLPFGADWRLALGAAAIATGILLAAGARRRPEQDRVMDLHRALGAVFMGAMPLLGGHLATQSAGAHAHGLPAHAILVIAAVVHLCWTAFLLTRSARRHTRAERAELIAMAAMFGAMLLGMSAAG